MTTLDVDCHKHLTTWPRLAAFMLWVGRASLLFQSSKDGLCTRLLADLQVIGQGRAVLTVRVSSLGLWYTVAGYLIGDERTVILRNNFFVLMDEMSDVSPDEVPEKSTDSVNVRHHNEQ